MRGERVSERPHARARSHAKDPSSVCFVLARRAVVDDTGCSSDDVRTLRAKTKNVRLLSGTRRSLRGRPGRG